MKWLIWGSRSERIRAEKMTRDHGNTRPNSPYPELCWHSHKERFREHLSGITHDQALGARKDLLRCGSWIQEERTIPRQCNALPPKAFVNPGSYWKYVEWDMESQVSLDKLWFLFSAVHMPINLVPTLQTRQSRINLLPCFILKGHFKDQMHCSERRWQNSICLHLENKPRALLALNFSSFFKAVV